MSRPFIYNFTVVLKDAPAKALRSSVEALCTGQFTTYYDDNDWMIIQGIFPDPNFTWYSVGKPCKQLEDLGIKRTGNYTTYPADGAYLGCENITTNIQLQTNAASGANYYMTINDAINSSVVILKTPEAKAKLQSIKDLSVVAPLSFNSASGQNWTACVGKWNLADLEAIGGKVYHAPSWGNGYSVDTTEPPTGGFSIHAACTSHCQPTNTGGGHFWIEYCGTNGVHAFENWITRSGWSINPDVNVKYVNIGGHGFTDYFQSAEDMFPVPGTHFTTAGNGYDGVIQTAIKPTDFLVYSYSYRTINVGGPAGPFPVNWNQTFINNESVPYDSIVFRDLFGNLSLFDSGRVQLPSDADSIWYNGKSITTNALISPDRTPMEIFGTMGGGWRVLDGDRNKYSGDRGWTKSFHGTTTADSYAIPELAGIAARLKYLKPELNCFDIWAVMRQTSWEYARGADFDLGSETTGGQGFGMADLNAAQALVESNGSIEIFGPLSFRALKGAGGLGTIQAGQGLVHYHWQNFRQTKWVKTVLAVYPEGSSIPLNRVPTAGEIIYEGTGIEYFHNCDTFPITTVAYGVDINGNYSKATLLQKLTLTSVNDAFIQAPLVFVTKNNNQTVNNNGPINLVATINCGFYPLTYTLRENGVIINTNSISSGDTSYSFLFSRALQPEENFKTNNYTLTVIDGIGTTLVNTFTVSIIDPPKLISQPSMKTISGSFAQFNLSFQHFDKTNCVVDWYFDGTLKTSGNSEAMVLANFLSDKYSKPIYATISYTDSSGTTTTITTDTINANPLVLLNDFVAFGNALYGTQQAPFNIVIAKDGITVDLRNITSDGYIDIEPLVSTYTLLTGGNSKYRVVTRSINKVNGSLLSSILKINAINKSSLKQLSGINI
jgi:hypothetical protein